MVISTLRSLFSTQATRRAQDVYIALVAQSREAFFYTTCAVPDTLDGRFEIITLHLFLALRLLKLQGPAQTELSRLLLECYFADMDRNLREMGVGDMGVSKRVKNMSKAAYGRLEAYTAAWDSPAELSAALTRNVYRGEAVPADALGKLLQYVQEYTLPVTQ